MKDKKEEQTEKEVRVMVVDDNESLVGMLKEYFEDHKKINIVLESYNGEDAINVIENNVDAFDVLLLDLIMPKKDGIYVLEQMSKKKIEKPVVIGTSFNADETIARVSKFNPKHFVLKPFDMVDLENKILDAVSFKPDENSKIIQKVLNDGNNNYTGIANYDNKALEKVEKIIDTGITWKDSMDNQQTDSKIKRGYKRNFIKSIVEYKENQIEEIKTGNLGEER